MRQTVELMMEKSNLARYMDLMLSNQDVSMPKPDPEIYNIAIARLGLKPEECLIVEDNQNGIKAAQASGANVMIVSSVEEVNYMNIKSNIKKFEGVEV